MNKQNLNESNSSKSIPNTRVKMNRKKTVGVTLPQNLVKQARKHKLNISRITEQALNSVLDYLETQNHRRSLDVLGKASFKEGLVGRPGLEPGTFCVSGRCPNQTRRPALNGF